MTKRTFFILAGIVALSAHDGAWAQCVVNAPTFTASGISNVLDNRAKGCVQWVFTYSSTGFSAVSIQVEGAPDNAGSPGSWSALTAVIGSNPSTGTTYAFATFQTNPSYVRVNLTSVTGTGTITYQLTGASGTQQIGKSGAGGGVTGVTATSPILSSGGSTPDISCPTCATGAPAFSALTGGTNTAAAMVVGSGASLGPTGTGTVTATQVPTAAGATATVNGQIKYDTTNNNLHTAHASADSIIPVTTVTPANGNCASWSVSASAIKLGDAGSPCGSGGSGGGGITIYSGSTVAYSGTMYFAAGGGAAVSATEATVQTPAPSAATVSNLHVQLSAALGTGNSAVFTWRDGGSSQTATCTIAGASATSCSDTMHSFSVAAGDLIDIQAVVTGTVVVTPTTLITSAFGTSGVGVTSVTATAPLTSSGGSTPNISATYQGNGTKVQLSTGTTTTNDCVKFDANGNTVDAGAACGSGGSGASVSFGTYASAPSCTTTPFFYNAIDSPLYLLCNGSSSSQWFWQQSPVTPATATSWAGWINQGSATIATQGGSQILTGNSTGARNLSMRYIAYPATPFSATACYTYQLTKVSYPGTGVVVSNGTSSSSSAILVGVGLDVADAPIGSGATTFAEKYTNFTTASAAYSTTSYQIPGPGGSVCVTYSDNGTTRKGWISWDGKTRTQFLSVSNTDFITPTELGFGVDPVGGGVAPIMDLYAFTVVSESI